MEIREFAEGILLAETLDEKLQPLADSPSDRQPGAPLWVDEPARPPELTFAAPGAAPKMPHAQSLRDAAARARAHHIMANHELQALEVMALILCAFPEAPGDFRSGLVEVMADEQRHTRMHIRRAEQLGLPFGTYSVNCYIWQKAQQFASVLDYLAGLPLTFEGRNLDHTLEFEEAFRHAGDLPSAAVMRAIHRDEIRHVAFGWQWLQRLKPSDQSDWQAYRAHLHWPLRPAKAKGHRFHREPRSQAGMSQSFLDHLEPLTLDDPP